jgi:hypothetical protein
MMITIGEIKEMPEARRLFRLFLTAFALWTALLFLLFRIASMEKEISRNLGVGDQIINVASTYRAYPAGTQAVPLQPGADALTVVSEIVEELGMRGRMTDLKADATGVLLQLDRLYGVEMKEFLTTIEKRGLRVKTAEVKALPGKEGRVLGSTFLLE